MSNAFNWNTGEPTFAVKFERNRRVAEAAAKEVNEQRKKGVDKAFMSGIGKSVQQKAPQLFAITATRHGGAYTKVKK